MESNPVPYTPSVLTSEAYNEAEIVFTLLQNKEKLISFLDCTTVLRAMGMNPTSDDMDRLKERMAEPVFLLEQWRREEELKREKERRKEEARERRGTVRGSVAKGPGAGGARKSIVDKVVDESKPPVKVIPVEEIKNIDWNIFIHCAEEMYRDVATEQTGVFGALRTFNTGGPSSQKTKEAAGGDVLDGLEAALGQDEHATWLATPGSITVAELVHILTTCGDSVLTPDEVKQLQAALPSGTDAIGFEELAARMQGTYRPPTQEELDRIAAAELEQLRLKEEAEKEAADDPLAGL